LTWRKTGLCSVVERTHDVIFRKLFGGGRDTAANIPGARLAEIPGMGHTLPPQVIPAVVEAFESVARPVKLARAA